MGCQTDTPGSLGIRLGQVLWSHPELHPLLCDVDWVVLLALASLVLDL